MPPPTMVDRDPKAETVPVSRVERREQQTERILKAAKTCFVRSGFQGASMQEICREAGMSPGALYRYFPSKESIIEAISEADRLQEAEILSVMLENPDMVEGVLSAVLAHIRFTHERGLVPLFTEVRAEAQRNEAVRTTRERSMGHARQLFQAYIQKGIDRGEIEPRADLHTLMTVMMAIGEGLVLNDLPNRGIDMEQAEGMMRASITANLRPTGKRKA